MAGRTAGYVFNQIRTLVDDPEGEFASDDYLTPFVQLAQDNLQNICLKDPNIGEVKSFIVLPNVPAGTTSLSQYLSPGGPLEFLEAPMQIREKQAGTQDINYINMVPVEVPIQNQNYGSLNYNYTWTGVDIMLPGSNQNEDFWIYGSFRPATIVSAETPLVPESESLITYDALSLVCFARGNEARRIVAESMLKTARSAFMRELYKVSQSISVRNVPFRKRQFYWVDMNY